MKVTVDISLWKMQLSNKNFTFKTLVMFEKAFKRTFVHVDDMARGIVYAIENYDSMKNNTFNVGGDFNNFNKEEIALMIKDRVDYYLHFAEIGEDEDKRNTI